MTPDETPIGKLITERREKLAATTGHVNLTAVRAIVDDPGSPDCVVVRRVGGYYLYLLTAQARTWVAEYVSDPKFDTALTGVPLVVGTREAYSILDGFMDEGMALA